ncbi:PSD1 and planctomycete cytochrome C domain-containing protein [Singulisphaera sp. PoT]|uniref:PSD1 and planctomycete cytochrome C domain-containing protein n=1 Tax=Singulisphaera sp. PoT TaxID=3411797 RepID=UPI003BF58FDC
MLKTCRWGIGSPATSRNVGGPLRGGRPALGVVAVLLASLGADAPEKKTVEFNRDIRPILSENCFHCHGPDKNRRKADLRLDRRDSALAKNAIVPGQPDDSELVARILSDDHDEAMPPASENKTLTPQQKDLLARWIREGAEYQAHWAYVAPKKHEPPAVADKAWVRNPIDAFILKSLEAKGIKPSPEADRRTQIRRLSLDLTGLPPTPTEVEAFLKDESPKAYEHLVDRLLDSPHYGERMAVPWLDLVRFTDTVGYHGDQNQDIFPYRDYVVDAFNSNLPFDRFTTEQLAGDLLPNPTTEQLVATGFNRLNMMTREGGAQAREYLAKYAADRVRTVAITWIGSTMGCAECHDHKYDPFTSKDFYQFEAFFADVRQWGVYTDYGYTPNGDLKGWTNDHPFPPEIEVESPYLKRRMARIEGEIQKLTASASPLAKGDEAKHQFEAWARAGAEFLARAPSGWETPEVVVADKQPSASILEDRSILLSGPAKAGDATEIRLKVKPGWVASIRLELLPHESHKGSVFRTPGAAGSRIHLAANLQRAKDGKKAPLGISWAEADAKDEVYDNGSPILGVARGWKTSGRRSHAKSASAWLLDQPVECAEGDEIIVTVRSDNLGRLRLAVSPFVPADVRRVELDEATLRAVVGSNASDSPLVQKAYLDGTGWAPEAYAKLKTLRRELIECREGKSPSMITQARDPLPTRVLPRGNWLDESGELVAPGVPGFLPQPPPSENQRLNRLDLARWMMSPENPLTSRVFVNRLWKQFFGTGISAVMEDVGAQGEWPAHPELLDWLAVEFRESGWNVKHMVRLLAMSATYRQDARLRPELRDIDPNNRLLASQSPRRLEAEFVRDNALAIAGLLNLDVGGPSAHPYQPADYYANIQFPNRDYQAERDDRQYRRGLYSHWQRTFLHPMLANFDAPAREECTASRTVANTPQQALTLLNDPSFVEAARALAEGLLATCSGPDADRIDRLFEKALARPPKPKERESLTAFLDAQRKLYRERPDDAKALVRAGLAPAPSTPAPDELAAWIAVCRVVLNLHETITRY